MGESSNNRLSVYGVRHWQHFIQSSWSPDINWEGKSRQIIMNWIVNSKPLTCSCFVSVVSRFALFRFCLFRFVSFRFCFVSCFTITRRGFLPITRFPETCQRLGIHDSVHYDLSRLHKMPVADWKTFKIYGKIWLWKKKIIRISYKKTHHFPASCVLCKFLRFIEKNLTTVLPVLFKYCCNYCYNDSRKLWAVMKGEGGGFGALKSDSTHHFFRNEGRKRKKNHQ
jgi:hypothetical protein